MIESSTSKEMEIIAASYKALRIKELNEAWQKIETIRNRMSNVANRWADDLFDHFQVSDEFIFADGDLKSMEAESKAAHGLFVAAATDLYREFDNIRVKGKLPK